MKKYLYTIAALIAIISSPMLVQALSVSWDRYIVGAERPLFPTDNVHVGAAATSTNATFEVDGSMAIASTTGGCVQGNSAGLLSFTGTNCSTGSSSSPATSTNPLMYTYGVATSTTATSTFAGPVSISGWTLSTSTSLEVCYAPDHCQYQIPLTSTSSDVQINAALLVGSQVKLPVHLKGYGTGTPYIISNIIQIPSNTGLIGDGSDLTVIKADNAYNPSTSAYGGAGRRVMVIGLNSAAISNSRISGVTFDANVQNIPGLTSNSTHRTIWIQSATNFTFDHNKVIDGINWMVYFNLSKNLWIQNNTVYGGYSSTYNQNDGIHTRNSQNVYIQNNTVDTAIGGGTSGDDAIVFVADQGANQDTSHQEITNNIITGSGSRGIIGDLDGTFSARNIQILGNIISSTTQAGIKLYDATGNTGQYYDIKINGNTLNNVGTNGSDAGHGIVLESKFSGSGNMYNTVTIEDNTIQNSVYTSGYAIYAKGQGTDINIDNNTIVGNTGIGAIKVGTSNNPVTDFEVKNNHINGASMATNSKAIYIFDSKRGVIDTNNVQGTTTGTSYGIYLESTASLTTSFNDVSHNNIYNVDNAIAEINSGAVPDFNQYGWNFFNSVSVGFQLAGTHNISVGEGARTLGFDNVTGAINISTTTAGALCSNASGLLYIGCSSFTNTLANGGTATTTFYTGGMVFANSSQLTQSAAASNLFWNETTKRFALGTTSPVGDLQIEKASPNLVLNNTPGNNTSTVGFYDGSNLKSYIQFISPTYSLGAPRPGSLEIASANGSNGNIDIRPNDTDRLMIRSSGLIGMSSSTPWGLLSVNPDGLGSNAPEFVIGSSTTTHFIVDGAGRVGIGDTNLTNKLEVAGVIQGGSLVTGNAFEVGDDAFLTDINVANTFQVSGTSNGALGNIKLGSGGPTISGAANNFGIATITPYATLSVQSGASTGDALAIATSSGAAIFGVDNDGHAWTSGPSPVLSTCGTGSPTVVGDDQTGTITTGTAATSCTMTFAKAFRKVPACNFNDDSSTIPGDVSAISTTAVTFALGAGLSGGHLYYQCRYHLQ